MTIPCLKGVISVGGEYSKCNRDNNYIIQPIGVLEDKDGRIEESLASAFGITVGNWGIKTSIRITI